MLLKGSTLMLLGAALASAPQAHASRTHASTRALAPDALTQVVVTYDPAKVTVAQMIAAVKTLTYTATVVAGPLAAPANSAPARASAGNAKPI
jgi:hypothetical protein